jgi:hypothetical protein
MSNKVFSRRVIDALFPEGALWLPKEDSDFDLALDAIAENYEYVRLDLADLSTLRSPQKTTILTDLEKEYGIIPGSGGTEQERRDYLSVVKKGIRINGTDDDLQSALRDADFDVYVHENGPVPIDPLTIIESSDLLANGDSVSIKPVIPENDDYWPNIFFVGGLATQDTLGENWDIRTSAGDHDWQSVTYGNGIFVAVSQTAGTGNQIMTSPDGATWTIRTSSIDRQWQSVTFGNGLFVAVANSGTGNTFVAVSQTAGTGNQVMTSPDGITWTIRTSSVDRQWQAVIYDIALFVAVANSGTGNRVMTSPDGVTWTSRVSAGDYAWNSIAYGNGTFVAVSQTAGVGNQVMTSPDGITWTMQTSSIDRQWQSVTFGNGLFIAVANSGTGNRVMTSSDGITWTSRTSAADNNWTSIAYGNAIFAASSNQLSAVANANIDAARESEFKRIILKYKPMHSWAGLVVTFV